MVASGSAIGVDIGGTKIAAAIVRDGVVERRTTAPTPRSGGDEVMRVVSAQIESLLGDVDTVAGIGVGAPGVIDRASGDVTSATEVLPGWAGTRVRSILEARIGLPVTVDNDVRVMARAEILPALDRGAHDVLFVSVGTGVGGAIARGGEIDSGPHGSAGELAHLLVPIEGATPCGCGRLDHLEAVAAGPAIAAEHARRTGETGLDLREIADRARGGDRAAAVVISDAASLTGRALAGLLGAIDADAVVIGGGVAQIGRPFMDPLTHALRAEVLAGLQRIPVTVAGAGTDAPLVGAALLATGRVTEPATPTREIRGNGQHTLS